MTPGGRAWRIGSVPYLNGRPLVARFREPTAPADLELTLDVPSSLAARLRGGDLDVALVSSVEAFRGEGVAVVSDIAIAADGPVRSVGLLSRVPLDRVRHVAVDRSSLTSAALLRVIYRRRYGIDLAYTTAEPNLPSMLETAEAAMLIGDPAMRNDDDLYFMDLGAAWKELTGLPFVYAVWLARDDAAAKRLGPALRSARDWGLVRLEEIAADWSKESGLPLAIAREYLTDVMHYDLSETKRRALETFRELCEACVVMTRTHPVRFL